MRKTRIILSVTAALLSAIFAYGQSADMKTAGEYHANYQFDKALTIYEKLLETAATPEEKQDIFGKMMLSENGQSMLLFAADPTVVATKTVPRKDFYLWYSNFKDNSWSSDGNYYPEGETRYFFSKDGNIYVTSQKDSVLWSAPEAPAKEMVSSGHEIFPVISPDGKELYFSSDGLFGMGGYDLYKSSWDAQEKKWGPVQNIGFPFSSVADDLLYAVTRDGKYIIFASNRDCDKDNVVIYVIKYDNFIRKEVPQSQAGKFAQLRHNVAKNDGWEFVKHNPGTKLNLTFEESEDNQDYTFKVGKQSVIHEENLPDGIVYQIRLFASANKAKQTQLKGLTPIFQKRQSNSKYPYVYNVGVFRTYAEATSALSKVKKAGFSGAYVIAFENNKALAIAKARQKETQVRVVTEEVRIVK